jgi:hypothetical protein
MLIGKFVSRGVSCAEILIVSMDELVCGDLAYGLRPCLVPISRVTYKSPDL